MKYIKTFEAIILADKLSKKDSFKSFEDVVEYGKENGFDVVEYDEFYKSLEAKDKRNAPPNTPYIVPFFALYHLQRKKPMFVISRKDVVTQSFFKDVFIDIISHERIHQEQTKRMGEIKYNLPSPLDTKKYLSNKEEVMAFSFTIANELHKKYKNIKTAIRKLDDKYYTSSHPVLSIWNKINQYCDENTIQRYRKYIYLYLEQFNIST